MRSDLGRRKIVLPAVSHSRKNPRRRTSRLELLEGRQLLAGAPLAAFHNSFNSRDVNADGRVSPADAILVINDLIKHGPHAVPSSSFAPLVSTSGTTTKPALIDVNGDNRISAVDALQVIHFLAVSPQVEYAVQATDLNGNTITTVGINTQFLMEVDVQDVRNPPNAIQGVFSGYLNVNYNNSLATIDPSATPTFGPLFAPTGTSFTLDPNGQILATGSFGTSITPPATGNAKQLLFTIPVTATAIGTLTFNPSFDGTLGHETLLYDPPGELAESDLTFTPGSVQVLPTLSVDDASTAEGNSGQKSLVFTVNLSDPVSQQITVVYTTAEVASANKATSNVDFQPTSGVLTFAPNVTSMPVTVLINGDTDIEADEAFNVLLFSPQNAFIDDGTGLGTILNDDSATGSSNISIGDKQVTNVGTGSTVDMVFTVSLSPTSTSVVTVQYATSDITATDGQDYFGTTGTLTFQPNDAAQFITVSVIGDSQPDSQETFKVTLSNPSTGAELQLDHATGTIVPLVQLPDLFIDNVTKPEGNTGTTTNFVFTATMVPAPSETVLVQYATVPGTATSPDDFVSQTGTITFNASQTAQTITIQVVGDSDIEASESFSVSLTPIQGSVGLVGTGIGTIQNDDGTPTLSISDATVLGGTLGSVTDAVFTVTLSAVVTENVTVGFATQDDTAVAPTDYQTRSGDLTFTPGGPTTQTITVAVLGAAGQQADESFFVNLSSNSPGVTIGDGQAIGTIVRQGLAIASMSQAEGTGSNSNFLFTVTLGLPRANQVTVAYSTADGSGAAGATTANNDYVSTSGILTFAPNQTSQVITVVVVGDSTAEGNETFQVNLSGANGAAILSGAATGTIVNDDGQAVLIQLKVADSQGTPLPVGASLDVNDAFTLQAYVQDIQVVPTGIAQAYLDVLYTSGLVQVTGPITYGPNYPSVQSGDTSVPGLINEAGAFGNLVPPAQPAAPQLLFSVPMKAIDLGIATFTPDPADVPGNDVQAYGNDDPFPAGALNFVGTEITIGANVLTVNSVSHSEGSSGFTDFVFTVTHIPPLGAATVLYSTSNGTAVAGQDYVATSGTLTFSVNDTTKTITVQVVGDALDEPDETFFVNLTTGSGATASQSPGVGTILDDDALPGLRVADASASEGQQLNFVVTMFNAGIPGPSGRTVTVAYHTVDLTGSNKATAGLDYTPTSGTLTFAPGVSLQTISVTALDDAVNEATETFQVVLSDPVNATLSDDTADGSIVNVQPVEIRGFVYVDNKPDGIKGNDLNGNPEVGIANVLITATKTNAPTSFTQTVLTKADGSYSFIGLPPGTYTITETQPGFFNDGLDTHNGVVSPTNDQFTGVTVGPSELVTGYNFGESNLRTEFVSLFLNRRALFASAVVSGAPGMASSATNLNPRAGEIWISFDGGWEGLRTISALCDTSQGSVAMTLYKFDINNALVQVALSIPTPTGAQLQYSGTTGAAYFLKLTGTNPNVSLQMTPPESSSAGPLMAPSATTTNVVPSVPANSDPPAPSTSTSTAAVPTKTVTFASSQVATSPTMVTANDATDAALAGDVDWVSDSLAV